MKGQRKPNPSESQPQVKATIIKTPVVTRGTVARNQPNSRVPGQTGYTIVDLRNRESSAWDGRRIFVEALQPVAHGRLRPAIVPDDIQQG